MKNILFVASGGGHLDNAVALLPAFQDCNVLLATYNIGVLSKTSSIPAPMFKMAYFADKSSILLAFSLIVNFYQFAVLLLKFKPSLIISTGSEIVLPAFLAARLFTKARLVHVESAGGYTDTLSLSARTLQRLRLPHNIYVQWPHLSNPARNVFYAGRVF